MKYSCNVIYNRGILMAFTSPFQRPRDHFLWHRRKAWGEVWRESGSHILRKSDLTSDQIIDNHHLLRATNHLLNLNLPTVPATINLSSPAVTQPQSPLSHQQCLYWIIFRLSHICRMEARSVSHISHSRVANMQ